MGELIRVVISAVVEFVAAQSFSLLGLAALALVAGSVTLFRNRRKVIVARFTSEDEALDKGFADFHRLVDGTIRAVHATHTRQQEAAGDLNIFRELAPQSAGDSDALEVVPGELAKAVVRVMLAVVGGFLRPPSVRGTLFREGDRVTLRASLYRRGKEPELIEEVSLPASTERLKSTMARQLGMRIIMQMSPLIAVHNWEALEHLTLAMEAWPQGTTQTAQADYEAAFKSVEAELEAAREADPTSPLVNYNLGVYYHYHYTAGDNERSLGYFETASRTDNPRLQALAAIGVARCYCQNYHRFGRKTPADLDRARRAAARAVELVEEALNEAEGEEATRLKTDYARALYCRAFAQHVTEAPEDIAPAVEIYKQVIEATQPNVPTFVYNNLGYILMARAGRFVAGGDRADYEQAREWLERALRREPTHKFALANLGNIERLLGDDDDALRHYRQAVQIDPNYANGWNEMAWVYLVRGQPDEAEEVHQRALSLAGNDGHRSEVKELYARALHSVGRHQEALRLIEEAQTLNPRNPALANLAATIQAALPA